MNISRQRAIQGALAALAIPRAVSAQAALPTVKVGTQPAEFTADIMYGIQEGFFQKAGVAIDLQYLTNGNITSEAILAGSVDIGLNDTLGVAQAHVRGVDLVFLSPAAAFATPWPTGFVTLPEANIRDAKDFNNKTIGTRGLRSAPNMMASAWIDNTSCALRIPSTSASTSSRVLYTAKEARAVAAIPKRSSGSRSCRPPRSPRSARTASTAS